MLLVVQLEYDDMGLLIGRNVRCRVPETTVMLQTKSAFLQLLLIWHACEPLQNRSWSHEYLPAAAAQLSKLCCMQDIILY